MSRLGQCRLISLPCHSDDRGDLVVAEAGKELPFVPERVFWISGVPQGRDRGQHAHRSSDEYVVALSGDVRAEVRTPCGRREFWLTSNRTGLYLPPMVWIALSDFSSDATVLALASKPFDEEDYFRNFDAYVEAYGAV